MSTQAGRVARSYLFAPGDNERLLHKVFAMAADAIMSLEERPVAVTLACAVPEPTARR